MGGGALKLEVRCPQHLGGLKVDPEPHWSWNALIKEVNSLELKLKESSPVYAKTYSRNFLNGKKKSKTSKAFIMRVSDDELGDSGSENDEIHGLSMINGKRFSCPEIYSSDEDASVYDLAIRETPNCLLNKMALIEGVLAVREFEHQQEIKEEVRNMIALEADVVHASERIISAFTQVTKSTVTKRDIYRKLDMHFQRKIAEARDNHVIAIQRDHEIKSLIEERKIRNDAASEESKRREKSLQEEKMQHEKAAQAEVEKVRAEELRRRDLEAERIAKEAAEREAAETSNRVSGDVTKRQINDSISQPIENSLTNTQSAGSMVKAVDIVLKLEVERYRKHQELEEQNITLRSTKNFRSYEQLIKKTFRKINGIADVVRSLESEFIQIMSNPVCPQSISIAMFANKAVYQCEISDNYFAIANVVVRVISKFPFAMDVLLAEFHKACIYTVPKHFVYSKSALSEEDYKRMGYKQDEGKFESTDSYLKRIASYMKLYGALVQTEIIGYQNLHGLKEGWTWLARFLNALPVNTYTAVALDAFINMAGFALFRKYKSQFLKILNVISRRYIIGTEGRRSSELNKIVMSIQLYIDERSYLKEPVGWRLETSLGSTQGPPQENQYYSQSNRWTNY